MTVWGPSQTDSQFLIVDQEGFFPIQCPGGFATGSQGRCLFCEALGVSLTGLYLQGATPLVLTLTLFAFPSHGPRRILAVTQ